MRHVRPRQLRTRRATLTAELCVDAGRWTEEMACGSVAFAHFATLCRRMGLVYDSPGPVAPLRLVCSRVHNLYYMSCTCLLQTRLGNGLLVTACQLVGDGCSCTKGSVNQQTSSTKTEQQHDEDRTYFVATKSDFLCECKWQ